MTALIEILLLIVLGFFLLYLTILSVLALFSRRQEHFDARIERRFACVVPAHDEEALIERTVRSLFSVDYRKDLFDVIVVADNCKDRTAAVVRSLGASAFERNDQILRGKGYALQWCFSKLLHHQPAYDAAVVVDADSVVSKNFLRVMNWYLEKGVMAVQGADLVEPKPGIWSSEVTRVALTLYNYVRPMGRKIIRCSAGLRGNGMCFAMETLRRVPWDAHSLTEDLEYGLMLLLNGIQVDFAPEATVFASMPEQTRHAESQRARWEIGRFPVMRRYALRLLRAVVTQRSFRAFDAFVDLLTPAYVNMLGLVLLMVSVKLVLSSFGVVGVDRFLHLWVVLFVLGLMYVIIGLVAARADRSLIKAVLYLPTYILWKMKLYAKLAIHGITKEWIRTVRGN